MNSFKKAIIYILMIALVTPFSLIPDEIKAQEVIDPGMPVSGRVELPSQRTADSKTFLYSDGHKAAEIYTQPIHYATNIGNVKKWEEIDSSLKDSGMLSDIFGDRVFQNQKNDFNIGISEDLTQKAFTFRRNDSEINFAIKEIKNKTGPIAIQSDFDQKPILRGNKVSYQNIVPDTDVNYYSLNDGIKEDIVLKKYNGQNEFVFNFTLENAKYKQQEDGSYIFYKTDTNQEIFRMPKLYMFDAKGGTDSADNAISYEITSNITQKKDHFVMALKADDKWLSDPARVFPVIIDPSIVAITATDDTYVQSKYPTTLAWDQRALYVGNSTTKGIMRALIPLSLPNLTYARILKGTFSAWQYGNCNYNCQDNGVSAYMTKDYDPYSVVWNNQPSLIDTGRSGQNTNLESWLDIDITNAVQSWYGGNPTGSKKGSIALVQIGENNLGYRTFAAQNHPYYGDNKPKLTIEYNDYNASYAPNAIPATVTAATTINIPITVTNTGRNKWIKGKTNLSYHVYNSSGAMIIFDGKRFALPRDINPGGDKFTTTTGIKVPPVSGKYIIKWDMVEENVTWFYSQNVTMKSQILNVVPPSSSSILHSGTEDYYATAGPIDLASGALSYSATDLAAPSPVATASMSRSYYSNTQESNLTHNTTGYIKNWIFNGPYFNNTESTRLSTAYIANEAALRPSRGTSSSNNVWYAASGGSANYIDFAQVLINIGAGEAAYMNKSAMYAYVYVLSPANRTVQMRVGSDDGVKIWLNNALVLNKDVYRAYGADTDIVTTTLKKGVNPLLVKVSQRDGGFQFSLRFTTTTGAIMNDLKYDLKDPAIYNNYGVLGKGWTAGFEEFVTTSDPNNIYYHAGNGVINTFTKKSDGTYQKPAGTTTNLIKNSDGTFKLVDKYSTEAQFNTAGKISFKKDLSGNYLSYDYDASNNLVTLRATANRKITFTYNTNGTLATANYQNKKVSYAYTNGQLSKVADPLGLTIEYTYDANGKLISCKDKNGNISTVAYTGGRVSQIIDPQGNATNLSYGAKTTSLTDALGRKSTAVFNDTSLLTSFTNAKNYRELYQYDGNYNLVTVTPDIPENEELYFKWDYAYDANDNLLTETNPLGKSSKYTYSATNDLLTATDPSNKKTTNVYSTDGRRKLIGTTDPKGNKTQYAYGDFYDSVNNSGVKGVKTAETDPKGNTTKYTYSNDGDLLTLTSPKNEVTKYEYDLLGQKAAEISPANQKTIYSYDANSRLTSMADAGGLTTKFAYDNNGNKIKETNPKGDSKTYAYDRLDRLIKSVDEIGAVVSYEYDKVGNKISTTDAKGKKTAYSYDELNQLTKETSVTGKTATASYNANGNVTSTTDTKGQTTDLKTDKTGAVIEKSNSDYTANLAYNDSGNVTQASAVNNNSPKKIFANDFSRFQIDGLESQSGTWMNFGGVLGQRDPDVEAKIVLKDIKLYDGAIEFKVQPDADNSSFEVRFRQNNDKFYSIGFTNGAWRFATDGGELKNRPGSLTSYQWYNLKIEIAGDTVKLFVNGELKLENNFNLGYPEGEIALVTHSSTLSFDDLNVYSKTDKTNVSYDDNNNLSSASSTTIGDVAMSYDANNNQTTSSNKTAAINFDYDPNNSLASVNTTLNENNQNLGTNSFDYTNGRLNSITKANGDRMNIGYDQLGRINSFENRDKNNNLVLGYNYEYDAASNITKSTDSKGKVLNYEYDARDELTKDNNASYTYDAMGNRQSMIGDLGMTFYYYDEIGDANRLVKVVTTPPHFRTVDFRYDDNGNVISKIDSEEGTTNYFYNADNYFTKADLPNGTSVEYLYDQVSKLRVERIEKKASGEETITKFVYDADRLVSETDAKGNVLKTYTWDENENLLSVTLATDQGSQKTYYYLKNAKGDIVGLSGSDGRQVAEYEYDSWGNVIKSATIGEGVPKNLDQLNNRLYSGYWYDTSLGLYFMKTRMYDPVIGRFLSPDPVVSGDSALDQNPYIYCGNNPIDRIDPSGKNFFSSMKWFASKVTGAVNAVLQSANQIIDWAANSNIPVISQVARGVVWATSGNYWRSIGVGFAYAAVVVGAAAVAAVSFTAAVTIAAETYAAVVNQGKSVQQLTVGSIAKYGNTAAQDHHVIPQYIGGPKLPSQGAVLEGLAAKYHLQITNAFRTALPYGSQTASDLKYLAGTNYNQWISQVVPKCNQIYSRFPIKNWPLKLP